MSPTPRRADLYKTLYKHYCELDRLDQYKANFPEEIYVPTMDSGQSRSWIYIFSYSSYTKLWRIHIFSADLTFPTLVQMARISHVALFCESENPMVSKQVSQSHPQTKSQNIGHQAPEFEIICTDHCQTNLEHKMTFFQSRGKQYTWNLSLLHFLPQI